MSSSALFLEGEAYRLFSYTNQIDVIVSSRIAHMLSREIKLKGNLSSHDFSIVESAAIRGSIDLGQF
ncbi:MAG: hypothetical protein WD509_00585 [Candidatus Paceibacterota bacterium]